MPRAVLQMRTLGSVRKALILVHAALKTASECSCTPVHSASSAVFALPALRLKTFRAEPRALGLHCLQCF